ncbi:hypothetical protein HDK90DRAFT_554964 [Phyllosticta capitalensis]|uniref:Major facilitator superfamily transporter n=1 Tax=Phyllosticta capitalensis TaxID=121624 RepID=A0ABR1YK94_9PEZI
MHGSPDTVTVDGAPPRESRAQSERARRGTTGSRARAWKWASKRSSTIPKPSSSSSSSRGITPILPLLLLLTLATLSTRLFSLPLNRVIESRYCAAYYDSPTPPPESQCKVDWVQTRLAWLQGVLETAVIGVDLGVAVPAAWVGDRWRKGRRVVLAANLVGWAGVVGWVVIVGHLDGALPVSAMAAAPFFALIGGHDCVLNSAVFAIVTDLTDDLVQRTSYIAYISSVNYVVSLFGPSLASAVMTVNLWLPFYLSIGFLIAALPVVYFLPLKGDDDRRDENTAPSAATKDHDPEAEPLLRTTSSSSSPSWSPSSSQPQPLLARFLHLLHRRPRFLLLLSSFLLTSLASSNTHLLPQYMSARYHRSFASVGPLLSLKAATNIVLLTFVVPVGMRVLLRRHHKQHNEEGDTADVEVEGYGGGETSTKNHNPATIALNINAALLSLAVSVLGALAIAAAPRVAWLICALLLYALGSALPVFTMALVEAVDGDGDGDGGKGKGKREGADLPTGRGGGGGGVADGQQEEWTGEDAESSSSSSALANESTTPMDRRRERSARRASTPPRPSSTKTASTSGGTARVYTVVMVVKTIGTLVGAPLMTAVWVAGINLNDGGRGSGAGLGLPYYVSAVLYLCAVGVVWCLKL